ncbi:hypothetical protein D3C81_1788360 [compost metagenome]
MGYSPGQTVFQLIKPVIHAQLDSRRNQPGIHFPHQALSMQCHLRQVLVQFFKLLDEHRNQIDDNNRQRGQEYGIDKQYSYTARHFASGKHTDHRIQHI